MRFSKLLFRAKYLKNGVGYGMGRRLLSSQASHPPCDKPEQVLKSKDSVGDGLIDIKGLVVGVFDNDGKYELSSLGKTVDKESGGKLTNHLNVIGPDFKLGDAFVVTDVGKWFAVALSNYGPSNAGYNDLEALDERRENTRWGVGAGHRALQSYNFVEQQICYDVGNHHEATAEAMTLSGWRFEKFKHHRHGRGHGYVLDETTPVKHGIIKGEAQNWARYLADMPANKMTPMDVAQEAINVLCPLGVQVTAHDRSWIEANNMQAFLTVARGSCETPIFLVCEYKGSGGGTPVLMAAKGVTFDSGGLCLKKPEDMVENRASMAGAAAALGAIKGLAELKTPVDVTLVVPLCENMISGQCMKVGDILPALNGVNIQIEDTDMEGRLMLADALVYGQSKYKPKIVIDVATLTRGIKSATGGGCYGCYSNQKYLWKFAHDAGSISGDRPWRFPLWNYYHRQIVDDPSVDLRNRGSGKGTPCIGAAFLKNFVCTDWLHFDITGVGKLAHDPPPYLNSHRMSGRPTRALIHTLINIAGFSNNDQSLAREGECKAKK